MGVLDGFKSVLDKVTRRDPPSYAPPASKPAANYATDIHSDDSVSFIRKWTGGGAARTGDPSGPQAGSTPTTTARSMGNHAQPANLDRSGAGGRVGTPEQTPGVVSRTATPTSDGRRYGVQLSSANGGRGDIAPGYQNLDDAGARDRPGSLPAGKQWASDGRVRR
jgi:hypothetical protein